MKDIQLTCLGCDAQHVVQRTSDIPKQVIQIESNWCPSCQDDATEPYREWHCEPHENQKEKAFVPDNQLEFPFGFSDTILDFNNKKGS